MKITAEYRADIKIPELYIIYAYKVKSGQDSVDLHSEFIILKNHNSISHIFDMTISYWGQTHGNWWEDPHYIEGIRPLGVKYVLEILMVAVQVFSNVWGKYVVYLFS